MSTKASYDGLPPVMVYSTRHQSSLVTVALDSGPSLVTDAVACVNVIRVVGDPIFSRAELSIVTSKVGVEPDAAVTCREAKTF